MKHSIENSPKLVLTFSIEEIEALKHIARNATQDTDCDCDDCEDCNSTRIVNAVENAIKEFENSVTVNNGEDYFIKRKKR